MPRSLTFFAGITLIIFCVIAYLGIRTLEHETLLRHYQSQTLAQTRTAQATALIMNILQQKAARLEGVTNLIQPGNKTVRMLQDKDDDIDDVFILEKNKLLYPNEKALLTQEEKDWIQVITPLINDPSLLYSHLERNEKDIPHTGWFIINENSDPILIYWRIENTRIVGFRLSYIKLMSDVINAMDINFADGMLMLKENGRLLYQSPSDDIQPDKQSLQDTAYLPYPLNAWHIEYYGQKTDTKIIYLWGGLFLLLVLATVALIMFRLYREYTQTARQARQQVNFVSQVSHELKTPLTNISLYAELLKEELEYLGTEDNTAPLRHIDVITSESQRLTRLIANVLTFTHTSKVHLQPIELNQLMTQLVQTFTPSFNAKNISISLRCPELITIVTDVDKLTQIISNFLSNAEKYAASGKKVDLIVEKQPAYVDIHVRDYGDGVPEKEIKLIFQPFYRIKSSTNEGVSGTGIGLTIARQLAESLQGEILVSHPAPGIQFTLRLKPLNLSSANKIQTE